MSLRGRFSRSNPPVDGSLPEKAVASLLKTRACSNTKQHDVRQRIDFYQFMIGFSKRKCKELIKDSVSQILHNLIRMFKQSLQMGSIMGAELRTKPQP